MKRNKAHLFSSVLSAVLAIGTVALSPGFLTSCTKKPSPPPDTEQTEQTGTDTANQQPEDNNMDHINYPELAGKPIASANYAKGLTNSVNAPVYQLKKAGNTAPDASFSVLWDSTGLLLTLTHGNLDSFTVHAGKLDKEVTPDASGKTEVLLPVTETGISVGDLGQYIPLEISVSAGGTSSAFDGFVTLLNCEQLFSHTGDKLSPFEKDLSIAGSPNASVLGIDAGSKTESGMIRMYDRFSAAKNPAYVRNVLEADGISSLDAAGKSVRFECDINIEAMPVYQAGFTSAIATYGFSFVLSKSATHGSVFFGFVNTANGLLFYVNTGTTLPTVLIEKPLGETFRLGVQWNTDNSLTVSVNGYAVGQFTGCAFSRPEFADCSLTLLWQRRNAAESAEDNFSVALDNLSISHDNTSHLSDLIQIEDLFGNYAVVKADGDDVYIAPEKLTLTNEITSRKFGITAPVVWKSSAPEWISGSGSVKKPTGAGELVRLTMYLLGGEYIASEKEFLFFVKATDPSQNVLYVRRDLDPYTGKAVAADTCLRLTGQDNSVVYDMGSITDISAAVISGANLSPTFLNKSFVTLYASDDNLTYRRIEDFSLLKSGNSDYYFYNFLTHARYLKIHCIGTQNTGSGEIFNSLQKLMTATANADTLFGISGFAKQTVYEVKNDRDTTVYDRIVSLSFEQLGINRSDLSETCADIRFYCDGKLLPHYYDNGTFHVRIFELSPNATARLTVLYGNPNAMSVANGNETFEIQYGSKTATAHIGSWRNSVAVMPDGSLLMMGGTGKGGLFCERSLDGGHTWGESVAIEGTEGILDGGGFIVDRQTGLVFYVGYTNNYSEWTCKLWVICSRDSGHTWEAPVSVPDQPVYSISYSDGLRLSTYDGDGPGVDYVFSIAASENKKTMAFFATAIYSCDGGKTWKTSQSKIGYSTGSNKFEGGVSEETIYERADGSLVLWARCQLAGVVHFAISHSYDHGVTWEENATLSNIYTSNTQPIIGEWNGTPVLLWGGNNSLGGTSYMRFPLNLAYSTDGAESFTGIQDLLFQTQYADLTNRYKVTNPDMTFFTYQGVDCAFIITPSYHLLIEDVGKYLLRTKGGFDSFEGGTPADEGWVSIAGNATLTTTGATDGQYAMHIDSGVSLSRSLPSMQSGSISFDLYVQAFGSGCRFELQSAFHNLTGKTSPVRLWIDETGKLYTYTSLNIRTDTGLTLKQGQNSVSVTFPKDGSEATLQVNGNSVQIAFDRSVGSEICFFTIWNGTNTSYCLDRFIAVTN